MKSNQSNTLQAFWVGIGSFSTFSLAIVSAVILSRYFSKTEYGSYKQIIYAYESLLLIFSAGLPRVFGYFLPRYEIEEGKDIVTKITLYLFGLGILFSVFLFFGSGLIAQILNNPSLESSIKLFSPVPSLLLPTLGIEGIFSSYKKSQYIAIYNTVSRIIMLILIVSPVLFYEPNLYYVLISWNIASFLSLIFAIYLIRNLFINVVSIKAGLSRQDIFKYSIPLVYASISGIFINAADQFYISRFFGSEVFAEFSNGFQQIPFVTMITGAASIVLMPAYSKLQSDKSSVGEIIILWNSALKKSATLIYPIVLFSIFYAKEIIVLLYSVS
ncbi:MAG: oligosaccharide flippase family protein [Saprospiraceae bacterium]|nr:oligosaccharide flippase family protein [Saprospiraceae bacterium]